MTLFNSYKQRIFVLLALISTFMFSLIAYADDMSAQDFLNLVLNTYKQMGGIPVMAKVALILTVVVSSMKVSFLRTLIWDKLPALAQTLAAPILALIGGTLGYLAGGVKPTLANLVAYVILGAGAVFVHEILDGVKTIPGVGKMVVAVINFIEGLPWVGNGGYSANQVAATASQAAATPAAPTTGASS